jgi:hypothetical protein
MLNVADSIPAAAGKKATERVHEDPAATVLHVPVCTKALAPAPLV